MRLRHPAFTLLLAVAAFCSAVSAQVPTFTSNASVHDPSVIKVGARFYVYGSHGASAWTEDLRNWTQVASSVISGSPPHFSTFQSELSELIAWTQANTLWAADVIQLGDGKFYYYYNVWTDLNGYRSYLGLAVADNIEGPYIDKGEILRGGAGVSGFDPRIHPNTIDPTLFRDKDGALWMVYGSYSGGIFVLEMNDQTGLPLAGQGWGKRIAGGNHSVMEGPFIEYNADTGYYYLFLSFGGLGAADGYNMRVFRSLSPDGPYLDPSGVDMTTAPVTSSLASIAPLGLKLAGNWRFDPVAGEVATTATGYLSPGHNSVMRDPVTGKWFNFFHTRFVGRGEAHEIRVHQLFFNEDGWPVMAPHRYAGETQGSYDASDLARSFKVINHGKDITAAVKTSSVVGLQADGGLAGASGSWSLVDGQNIRITIDGVLYKGVVSEQWDNENRVWVNAFTAIAPNGEALWGSALAIVDREPGLPPPDLEPIPDQTLPMGAALSLTLNNRETNPSLLLERKILQGPEGLQVDPATWAIDWTPLASQLGRVYTVRIQVYDLLEPDLADEVQFSVYAGGGYDFSERALAFGAEADAGILDSAGKRTGLTARLSGTGTGYANSDPNLTLDAANSQLRIRSTPSDFNGQSGVALASAVGLKLSELGFTGAEDFVITAEFAPIAGLGNVDQVGVFVGASATTLTRAGIIQFEAPQGLGVHTQAGADANAIFNASAFDLSDGLTVTISRTAQQWSHVVDGVLVSPAIPNAVFLDGLTDLTAGVFAISPLSGATQEFKLTSFRVAVLADELRITRIQEWKTLHFGLNPAAGTAGHDDDPDRDGRTNLLEYALGSDPMRGEGDPLASLAIADGNLRWTLTQIDDPALTYAVWSSQTLAADDWELIWRSAAGSNETGPIQIAAPLATDQNTGPFLRLSVETVE